MTKRGEARQGVPGRARWRDGASAVRMPEAAHLALSTPSAADARHLIDGGHYKASPLDGEGAADGWISPGRDLSRADAEGELRPSARGASEFVECPCPAQSAQAPDLAGHHCCGCSDHWSSDGCVRRHRSRTSSPYRDLCPWPKVGNRTEGSQLAYAPGNWLFVGHVFPTPFSVAVGAPRRDATRRRTVSLDRLRQPSPIRQSSATLRPRARYRSGSGSLSQLISSDENATGSSSCGKCPSPSNSRQR